MANVQELAGRETLRFWSRGSGGRVGLEGTDARARLADWYRDGFRGPGKGWKLEDIGRFVNMNRARLAAAAAAIMLGAGSAQAAPGTAASGANEAPVRTLSANAQDAVMALEGGLKAGGTLEGAHASGFKAEQALLGLSGVGRAPAVRAGEVWRFGAANAPSTAPDAGKDAAPADPKKDACHGECAGKAVPTPPVAKAPEPDQPGFFARTAQRIQATVAGAKAKINGMGRAKKIALLTGLLAAEIATIAFPVQAITVVFIGMGVLGLVGTTRELIATMRRGGK